MTVFSKAKFLEVEGENAEYLGDNPELGKRRWIDWFDGEEMVFENDEECIVVSRNGLPFFIQRNWCVEKED